MQEYNKTLIKDEEDLQFLLQVIANHCQLYSTANKTELMQSWLMADTENFNKVILLGRITVLHMYMRSIVIDYRLSSVVCRSVTVVSPAKMAQPIEMLFSVEDSVGPRNHVLDGCPDLPMEGAIFRQGRHSPL